MFRTAMSSTAVYPNHSPGSLFMSTLPASPAAPSGEHTAYDYALVDVFAERVLEGNQLAIFTDARGLSDTEMQALARETNLSETTFILPRSPEIERERGGRVGVF